MNKNNTVSYHVGGGYWAHITWNNGLAVGTDQHGRKWTNPGNPKCETEPWLKPFWENVAEIIQLTTKAKLI